jgi:DnaK suppressor protein
MLCELQENLQEKVRSMRAGLPARPVAVNDADEASVEGFTRDLEVALAEMESRTLHRIDDALRRLREGTYGTCTCCGAHISASRLRALPFAALCTACQRRVEEEMPPASPRRFEQAA